MWKYLLVFLLVTPTLADVNRTEGQRILIQIQSERCQARQPFPIIDPDLVPIFVQWARRQITDEEFITQMSEGMLRSTLPDATLNELRTTLEEWLQACAGNVTG